MVAVLPDGTVDKMMVSKKVLYDTSSEYIVKTLDGWVSKMSGTYHITPDTTLHLFETCLDPSFRRQKPLSKRYGFLAGAPMW